MPELVELRIVGDSRDVHRRLEAVHDSLDEVKLAAWLALGADPILRARTAARFASEGDELSGPWAKLRPATVARRQKDGFSGEHPINVRTGSMKRHLLDAPPRVTPNALGVTMWSPGGPGDGDTASKVRTAQQGGVTPEGRPVVPRPVLGVGPVDLEAVMLSLAAHIQAGQPMGAGGRMFT